MNPANKYGHLFCATCWTPMGYIPAGPNMPVAYCDLCAQDVYYTLAQLHIPGYQQFIDTVHDTFHYERLERHKAASRLMRNLNQFVIDKNT